MHKVVAKSKAKHKEISFETRKKLQSVAKIRFSEKINNELKNKIVNEYKSGNVTKNNLAEKFNIPLGSIQNILRYWESVREKQKTKPTQIQKRQIINLFKDNLSYDEISNIVGLEKRKVVNICKVYRRNLKTNIGVLSYGTN